ncbi:MAG TPA: ATP-binding protein, partial [Sphingobacteriaceae bacterium]
GPVFYNLWMIFGIASAIIVSCLAFADYYVKKDIATPIIGTALLCAALFDAFYFITYSNQTQLTDNLSEQINLRWFISRILHSSLLILGTLFYLGVRKKDTLSDSKKQALLIRITVFFGILLAIAIYFTGQGNSFTPVVLPHSLITHPLALIPLVMYLIWGMLILPAFIKQNNSIFSKMLVLSMIPAILAQCFMATHQHAYDSLFNIAYFLRAVNYIVPLFGIGMNYMDTIRNEKKVIEQLDSEIKERIHAQQVLEKREALLASAERIAGLGSWEFDTESGEVKWSDEMFGIFGYSAHQVTPSIALQEKLTAPQFREALKKEILTAIRKKTSYSLEYEIIRPGGKRRFVLGQGKFITNGNKLVGTLLDLTELREANQKLSLNEALLREKIEELNRSNTELEQFAYIASHDLQEPLRKIRAFGERLEHKFSSQLPEEGLDYLERMKSAAERMQKLIDDLLTFSRLTRTTEAHRKLDLKSVFQQVISDLEYAIEKKNARIEINTRHCLEAVPSQIHQLFQNLVSNALKFTKPDATPVISITSSIIKGSEASNTVLLPDKEYCRITIQDNGIGFDSQYAEKIFVLFQRLHTRAEYPGTGIGLAICKKIIDNHNGWIGAESAEGEGATFTLILPLNQ